MPEDENIILKTISSEDITESQKLEFASLRNEIAATQNNLLTLTLAVVAGSITLIGLNFFKEGNTFPYLYLLPLLVIELGFWLFKQHMERMRRVASYIRCFIEPKFSNIKWEESLYVLRKVSRAGKENYYSKDYYHVALFLSSICFVIGAYEVAYLVIETQKYNIVSGTIYLFAIFYWVSNRLPYIKKHSQKREGADEVEEEYSSLWKDLKKYIEGSCLYLEHLSRIVNIFHGREPVRSVKQLEELEMQVRNCPVKENCHQMLKIKDLKENLAGAIEKNDVIVPNTQNINWRYVFLVSSFFIIGIILWIIAPIPFFRLGSIVWYNHPVIFWLIEILFLLVIKVKTKDIYYLISDKHNTEKLLLKISLLQQSNISLDRMERKVTLFSWIFWHSWRKTSGREYDRIYIFSKKLFLGWKIPGSPIYKNDRRI